MKRVRQSMPRLRIDIATVFALATVMSSPSVCGYEVVLPPVGATVNYAFNPPERVLEVASAAATASAFAERATFAGGKWINKIQDLEYAPSDFIAFDVILRGPGIKSALLEDFRQFDEHASLIGPGGTKLETAQNHAYGYDDSDDTFIFGWTFVTSGNLSIHGFEWQITPDFVTGRAVPQSVNISMTLWGSPMFVVPEPAVASAMLLLPLHLVARRRRPAT